MSNIKCTCKCDCGLKENGDGTLQAKFCTNKVSNGDNEFYGMVCWIKSLIPYNPGPNLYWGIKGYGPSFQHGEFIIVGVKDDNFIIAPRLQNEGCIYLIKRSEVIFEQEINA